ncbi:MAG: alpha-galactosidase [Planctomycetes bacterium]|nr:alpha-galactosidase [Planctomycetota bacterium]
MPFVALLALLQDVTVQSGSIEVRVDPFGRFTVLREGQPVFQDVELTVGAPDWPGSEWEIAGALPPLCRGALAATHVRLLRPAIRDVRKTARGITIRFARGFEVSLEPASERVACVVRVSLQPEREMAVEVLRLAGRTDPRGVALTNGFSSWDTITAGSALEGRVTSHSVLVWGTERSATLAGFLRHRLGLNMLRLDPTGSFEAVSWFGAYVARETLEFDPLEFRWGPDPQELLEEYVESHRRPLRMETPPTGWMSFHAFGDNVHEEGVLKQAEFIAGHLPHVRYVQLNRGYQRAFGDWEMNDKFPHGPRWLADKIRSLGLKPGLYVAPFGVSPASDVYVRHPDWLVQHQGRPYLMDGKVYCLDPTHPEVQEWLRDLMRRVVGEWGYELVKLDALRAVVTGRSFRGNVTPVQAYQLGLKCIREGAGDALLIGCGAPMYESIGFLDGMYTGYDVTIDDNGLNGTMGGRTSRYALDGRVWRNLSEPLLARSALSMSRARLLLSLDCCTGQSAWLGDDFPPLDADRLTMLQRALPPPPVKHVRPLDVFARSWGGVSTLRRGSERIQLPPVWKFRRGDDKGWSAADFDEAGWEDIRPPRPWEPPHEGVAWYRVRFKAPPGEAMLELGKIDDRDETYLNGEKIGETTGWREFRKYRVALKEDNVLAVRVRNENGTGGLYSTVEEVSAEVWRASIDDYDVYTLLNYSDVPKTRVVKLEGVSCAYETWSGEFRRDIERLDDAVEPRDGRVWVVRRASDRPRLIANPGHIAGWGSSAEWRDGTLSGSGEALIDPAGYTADPPLEARGSLLYVNGERWSIRFAK